MFLVVRVKGAGLPGLSTVSAGDFSTRSWLLPSVMVRVAVSGGMGKVDPSGCSRLSPAPEAVSGMVSGMGLPGSDRSAVRAWTTRQTLEPGQPPPPGAAVAGTIV